MKRLSGDFTKTPSVPLETLIDDDQMESLEDLNMSVIDSDDEKEKSKPTKSTDV